VDVVFGPDGRTFAMLGDRGTWLFEIGGLDVQCSVSFHLRPILAIDLSLDGRSLACLSGNKTPSGPSTGLELGVWDLVEGRASGRVAIADAEKIDAVSFDGPGRLLAYRGPGSAVEFWGTKEAVVPKPLTVDRVTDFRLSEDGLRLWAVAGDEVVSVDLADGSTKTRWSNKSSQFLTGLSGLTCLDVGRSRALVGGRDGYVRLLHTLDGQAEATWNPGDGLVRSVGLSPEEDYAAAGSQTGGVSLFRISDGEKVTSWNLHSDAVRSIDFADDGRLLASGSADKTVRLYRRDAGRWAELMALPEFSGPVRTVRFGPGGRTLAVHVDGERSVRLWDLDLLRRRLAPMGLEWPVDDLRPTGPPVVGHRP
jgi:WD40 repeat protein